jgi:cation transport ATPase
LVSLAALSTYFLGLAQTFRGSSQTSFDTAIVLVAFFLAAKLIARNAEAKTSRWIGLLHRALPQQVRQFRDGQEHFVSITVFAGTTNLDDLLFVNVARTGADTQLARTITALERALADSSPPQNDSLRGYAFAMLPN